jgi:acetyl esterase/lipase
MNGTSNDRQRSRSALLTVAAAAIAAGVLGTAACSGSGGNANGANTTSSSTAPPTVTTPPRVTHSYPHVTARTTYGEIIDDPAFAGFGVYLTPFQDAAGVASERRSNIDALHAEDVSWDPPSIVAGLNLLIDRINAGDTVWYPLYDKHDIARDESKKSAGMFFIPGEPNKPVAIVAAGGGFRWVMSLQEAFPYAKKLHDLGYNVAVLKYRVTPSAGDGGSQARAIQRATEDMAAAMTMLKDNSDAWHISLKNYSVWGSSAGGQIMSAWASDGPNGAKANGFDQPAVVIDAYTPVRGFEASRSFPPLFDAFAANDPIGSSGTDAFISELEDYGIDVHEEKYPSGGHGFGLGVGTPAAGWLDRAVAFWQDHMTT